MKITTPTGTTEEWERYELANADSTSDPNSMVVSSSDDGTKATVTIDRNQGATKLIPSESALWFFDTDLQAQDQFDLAWQIDIYNHATLQSSNIAIYAGLTADTSNLDNEAFGAGLGYQLANARLRRWNGSSLSVSGQNASTRGVHCNLFRGYGSNASCGNIAVNTNSQAVDSSYLPTSTSYTVSNVTMTATSATDPIKLFVGIGLTSSVASNVNVEFAVSFSPLIKR